MHNNLFIDTMDKINKLAKSKGFVNGIDWAKAAKKADQLSAIDLAGFEKCHDLRNMIAHGCASDVTITAETLAITFSFLSNLEKSTLTQTAAKESQAPYQFNPNQHPQEGDFVIIPFFQGVIDPHTHAPAVTDESKLYMEELPEAVYFQNTAGIISSMDKQILTGYFMVDTRKQWHLDPMVYRLKSHGDADISDIHKLLPRYNATSSSLYHGIVLRPDTTLKLALLAAKEPLYTSAYTLGNGKASFTVGVKRDDGHGAYLVDFITGREDLQTYTCRGYLVPLAHLLTGIPLAFDIGESSKLNDNLLLSFPPTSAMPYYQWWRTYNLNGTRRPQQYMVQLEDLWEDKRNAHPF